MRDRLVCGLRNDTTQKRLLSEAVVKAVQIASSMGSAEKQSLQFHVKRPGAICQGCVACNRCNSTDHSVQECRIKDSVVYFRCRKKRTHCKSLSGEGTVSICSRERRKKDKTIWYRQMECHGNADALSRLPIVGTPVKEERNTDAEVYNVTQLETIPVTYQQLKTATNHDPILGQVVQCIRNGCMACCSFG